MKKYITSVLIFTAFFMIDAQAQSSKNGVSLDMELKRKIAKKTIPEAQLGMLMCENANGKMVICSGNIEETVLGIATNVPYVTLNKPSTSDASKFIFNAFVSATKEAVGKGDLLMAGRNGNLVKTENQVLAYAIALDDMSGGQGTMRVKLLSK